MPKPPVKVSTPVDAEVNVSAPEVPIAFSMPLSVSVLPNVSVAVPVARLTTTAPPPLSCE